jgi:ribonuclease Z
VLTRLIPPLGADRLDRYQLPTVLTEADYRKPIVDSGFKGNIIVGTDLACVRSSLCPAWSESSCRR